jgi:hypothetical protein
VNPNRACESKKSANRRASATKHTTDYFKFQTPARFGNFPLPAQSSRRESGTNYMRKPFDPHVISAVLLTARLTIPENAATTTGKRRRKALVAIDEKVAGAISALIGVAVA